MKTMSQSTFPPFFSFFKSFLDLKLELNGLLGLVYDVAIVAFFIFLFSFKKMVTQKPQQIQLIRKKEAAKTISFEC